MTVDEYLNDAPEPQGGTLRQLRADLREILPDATEEMSYGMPAFKVGGKAIAGYGYYKNHCSYFPHSGSVLPVLAENLATYKWTKGTLQFPTDRPLPRPLLVALVAERMRQLNLN